MAGRGHRPDCLCRLCNGGGPGGAQYGPLNASWKGGLHVDVLGYRWLRPGIDDKLAQAMVRGKKKPYVQEHRLVMARSLGRALVRGEVVHHINGDKLDNRIENLRLYSSQSEHVRARHTVCPHCGGEL